MSYQLPVTRGPLIMAFFATVVGGCGDNMIPAEQVGESQHFRLWIDHHVEPWDGVTPDHLLRKLEDNWTDMRGFFATPENKIDYYWLTPDHVTAACGQKADACYLWPTTVFAPFVPYQHELNHAYAGLRRAGYSIPFLDEGLANALGCSEGGVGVGASDPWRSTVTGRYGARFVHHLVTTWGIEAFLGYYAQAPAVRDADLFAANFGAFWSRSLDDVWAEMLATPLDRLSSREIWPICPCSMPPMILDGEIHPEFRRNDYWLIPELEGDTVELRSDSPYYFLVDCAAETTATNGFKTFLARLKTPHYVKVGPLTGRRGNFLSDTCEGADVYDLPADQIEGEIGVIPGSATGAATLFMQVRTSEPRHIWSDWVQLSVCSTCDFAAPECAPLASKAQALIDGTAVVRLVTTDNLRFGALPTAAQPVSFGP